MRHFKDYIAIFLQIGDKKDICKCDLFDELIIYGNFEDESAIL